MRISQEDAVNKAVRAFRIAEAAHRDILKKVGTADGLDRAWREFVLNWRNAYDNLEKANNSGQHSSISQSLKSGRKNDQAIRYLYQARDTDEHVGFISQPKPSLLRYGVGRNGAAMVEIESDNTASVALIDNYIIEDGIERKIPDVIYSIEEGNISGALPVAPEVEFFPASLELIDVENRSGKHTAPFGDLLGLERIHELCRYGLNFLRKHLERTKEKMSERD